MLYLRLDFDKNITVDALVVPGVYVAAVAENDWDTLKHRAPNIFLKIDDPPFFSNTSS